MYYKTLVLGLLSFIIPAFVHAAALININTADAATLDTLPGIGATKAQAIIDYRVANGSFATIEDIMKVKGIGQSTFDEIKPLITVGEAVAAATGTPEEASSTPAEPPASGSAMYAPPPSSISVRIEAEKTACTEAPFVVSAAVKTKGGSVDSVARILWSFGDGSGSEGSSVTKIFHYPGTYRIVATASDGAVSARDKITVVVKDASVRIAAVSGEGMTLANDASEELDLSGWRITSSAGIFTIPLGTTLLPKASALFPFTVMNMPIALDATLTYPSGVIAARYVPHAAADTATSTPQLSGETSGSQRVQGPSPAARRKPHTTNAYVHAHEETAVLAPAAPAETGAAGAPMQPQTAATAMSTGAVSEPLASTALSASVADSGKGGFLAAHWHWLLGAVAAAGAAFMVL